jgi:hypothetical protein
VNPPAQLRKAALVAIGAGTVGWMVLIELAGFAGQRDVTLPVSMAFSCLAVWFHDARQAKRYRTTILDVRTDRTSLTYLILAWVGCCYLGMYLLAGLRPR